MAVFAPPTQKTWDARFFARMHLVRQVLVFQLSLKAESTAVLLPLPTASLSQQAARFIDLSGYPSFFEDLDQLVHKPEPHQAAEGLVEAPQPAPAVRPERARFVPSVRDLKKVDPHFSLLQSLWAARPVYKDYGFAIIWVRARGPGRLGPIALEFQTRSTDALYFPGVFAQGGSAPSQARYDHRFFGQRSEDQTHYGWSRSQTEAAAVLDQGRLLMSSQTTHLIEPGDLVYWKDVRGDFPNQDFWLKLEGRF